LVDIITGDQPLLVFGDQYQRFEQVFMIFGEILNKKYIKEETGIKLALFIKKITVDPNFSSAFLTVFDKLSHEAKERIQLAVKYQG
jgi:hypothetical protein